MRRHHIVSIMSLALVLTLLPVVNAVEAQVTIEDGAICTEIVDRMPSGTDTVFAKDVGRLYCFTRVVGVEGTSTVTHVWYWGDVERARVTLSIRSPNWRTNSSKLIQEHEVGDWRVEVLDAEGNEVTTLRFRIRD
jgi:hypothetical protein